MIMAAKALLDRNPAPSRADVVEAISGNICRCTGYEPIINAILAAAGGRAQRLKDQTMLELRKDIFADERDDNLQGDRQGHAAPGHARPCHRHTSYFNDHKLQGMLHLKVRALDRITCADPAHRHRATPSARPACAGSSAAPTCRAISTRSLSLIKFGKDDEPSLAVDKVRYKGEPIVAVVADSEREALEALAKVRVDYEPLPAVFDVEEALKPGAPVVNETYPKNAFIYHDVYDRQKLRFGDVEPALRDRRPRARTALPDVADRARADRDDRLHRGARHQRALCRLYLDAGAVLHARHLRHDPRRPVQHLPFRRRHRRRRLWRQGRT